MASSTLTVRVSLPGAQSLLAAFNALPREANKALRVRTREIADVLAVRIRAAGRADSAQSARAATTVKSASDRVPVVKAGGTSKAAQLLYGSEFGMSRRSGWYAAFRYRNSAARQFRPHQGAASYWFFDAAERNDAEIGEMWARAADDVAAAFVGRG